MGREGPVLYCMDNIGVLRKDLILEEKPCSAAILPVKSCSAISVCLAGTEVLSWDVNLGSISPRCYFQINTEHIWVCGSRCTNWLIQQGAAIILPKQEFQLVHNTSAYKGNSFLSKM